MTSGEAEAFLNVALRELLDARDIAKANPGNTLPGYPDLIINVSGGEVMVREDGSIIFQPNRTIIRKAFSDSRREMMIGGIAGRTCPTCHGNGTL